MKSFAFILLLFVAASGCMSTADPKTWIVGSLVCLEDGTKYEMRIQKVSAAGGSGMGGIQANNEIQNLHFTGQYVGILHYNNVADTEATLTDSTGTVIDLQFRIKAGFSPHGFGKGKDNHGHHYTIMF